MSVLSRLLPVLMAPVVVAGCSFSSSEPWQPPEAPESQTFTTFGRPVPSGDYATLQAADQVRSVDPCALLGPDRLARYDGIATVGPSRSLSECVINLTMAGSRSLSVIEVDLSSNGPSSDDQTLDVAGETVAIDNVLSSEFRCVVTAAHRQRFAERASASTGISNRARRLPGTSVPMVRCRRGDSSCTHIGRPPGWCRSQPNNAEGGSSGPVVDRF